ncbi:MAG: hypothetical protein Q8L56_11360 [Rhodocyclaceae bacterium]|nr:hypothetical protein [Rhodocyclaceae bacterium]
MTNLTQPHVPLSARQRGVVLFIALIALVAMSLAAVALIRSVDTSTLIAGNLAFKQTATSSGDSGPEGAIAWLANTYNMNPSEQGVDPLHPFNNDDLAAGYYSSINEAAPLDLFAAATWAMNVTAPATGALYDAQGNEYFDAARTRPTGNTVRYIIQRMGRVPNQLLICDNFLFGETPGGDSKAGSPYHSDHKAPSRDSVDCPSGRVSSPIYRITARVTGPKNTVSYIQAYAY